MEDSFLDTFLLISGSQGILISLALIFSLFRKRWSNGFLGLITLVISLEILTIWAVRTGYTSVPGRLPFWILSSYLILPPALYLLGKINTIPNFRIRRWHTLMFLPALMEILLEIYGDYASRYFGQAQEWTRGTFWYVFTEIIPILAVIGVLILFGRDIWRLAKHLKKLGIQHNHLGKVRIFHLLFSLITLIWVLEALFQLPILRITITLLCGFVFLIGYISFYNPNFLLPPPFLRMKPAGYEIRDQERDTLIEKIRDGFRTDGLYLRPRLTLREAAGSLGIPPRHLSEAINRYYEMDFSNFVNSHRVEEVIRKVEAGELQQKTLLGVALESGFNSKSSFNQAFKDLKGKSPSRYFSER